MGTYLVSWRSKKQDVVSHSSTEVEYRAHVDTTYKLVWLRWLLADMDAPQPIATLLYCDNLMFFSISFVDQPADIFTKTHLPDCFRDIISKLQFASSLPP